MPEALQSAETPTCSAWYELVPKAPVTLKLTIRPGDHVTAKVTVNGTTVKVSLADTTTGQSVTTTLHMSEPDTTSAEWIAEAPSACSQSGYCRQIALANFGTVTFTKVAALASISGLGNQGGTISSPLWQATPIQLVPQPAQRYFGDRFERPDATSGSAGASPVGLAADGSSFSVNWVASATSSGG